MGSFLQQSERPPSVYQCTRLHTINFYILNLENRFDFSTTRAIYAAGNACWSPKRGALLPPWWEVMCGSGLLQPTRAVTTPFRGVVLGQGVTVQLMKPKLQSPSLAQTSPRGLEGAPPMLAGPRVFARLVKVRHCNCSQVSSRGRCSRDGRGHVWGLHTVTCLYN